jgi:hypothetical protein
MGQHKKWAEIKENLIQPDALAALNDIVSMLEVPHQAQELVSSEKTPTLSIAFPTYEQMVENWAEQKKLLPFLGPFIDTGINEIRRYAELCRRNKVYALAMSTSTALQSIFPALTGLFSVLNPTMKTSWMEKYWGLDAVKRARKWTEQAVCHPNTTHPNLEY